MKFVFILCALLIVASAQTSCSSNQVYVKFIKKTGNYASEESWEIYSSGQLIYTSPTLVDNEVRTIEQCLSTSTNNQYTIKLKDTYGDSWSSPGYLEIQGEHGNIFFKNFLSDYYTDEFSLSLYYGIKKADLWRITSGSVTGTWTEYNFGDSAWAQANLDNTASVSVSGTQYFRKTFVGLANMAAYEVSFKYRYGIVAYINGAEIYRDNMPDGVPTATTIATGSYSTLDFHGTIRPGAQVANSQSVLAVEVHFLQGQSPTTIDFDCYLAIMASDATDGSCFVYPYDVVITSTNGYNPSYLMDWGRSTSFYTSTFPTDVFYSLSSHIKPYVNGFRIWPYTSHTSAPSAFKLQGGDSTTTSSWTNVIVGNDLTFTSGTYNTIFGYFNANLFNAYRFQLLSSPSTTSYIYEGQLVTCNVVLPTNIAFANPTYTYYAKYETVNVAPVVAEFTGCTISPQPPEGLTFDTTTCTLSGKGMSTSTAAYTVSSTMNGQQYTGSFTLQITECAGTLVNILRTYGSSSTSESFSIIDESTLTTVYSVASNSGQPTNTNWNHVLCLTGTKYSVHVGSTTNYWYSASHIYVNTILDDNDFETIVRARYDNYLGLDVDYYFNAQYAIKSVESWYYKMNEVPTNWYNSETSGWTSAVPATAGAVTAPTNQIQLYKKTFNVASVANMAGVVISLKYQYGVQIYLNNHEVFRKGFTGDLSTSTYSSTSLNDANFRQISLPIKSIATEGSPAVDYITTGTNTIAIALVAAGPAMTSVYFDCAVRLMGETSSSRVFDYTLTYSTISGSPSSFFNHYYGYTIYYSSCATNYMQITFNDDRHEWISSTAIQLYYTQGNQQPRQFVLKAKNAEDTEWTTLKTVTGLTWSLVGQRNRIWVLNNKAYNQYRFENFATGMTASSDECYWKLGLIDLLSDSTVVTIPALTYPTTNSIYKDIEMAEIYPNSDLYTDFTINPPLPTGVSLDGNTGTISGTATAIAATTTYTVSAKKFTGEVATATFSLAVEICTGGKSLITFAARIDSYPSESSYRLYQGKSATGTPISSNDAYAVASNINYQDFCLTHDIYTLELRDTYGDGWSNPAGYYLYVDVDPFKFEIGQVKSGTAPVSVTTMFSSLLPFQIEYDDWKVYKSTTAVAESWNTVSFDDSTWSLTKAAQIGSNEAVTTYIRREVTIPDIADYSVLNVRIKYAGGVVAYFNGRQVARFNLEEEFTSETESIELHSANVFSMFHILLATSGGVTGKNVIAFEIHRPLEQSSAEPVVFDATGVFGVNQCSIAVDSVINVQGTEGTTIGDLENFFDLTTLTYGYQPNAIGTYLQWTVENLDGSKFNSFAMQTVYAYTWGFSVYGRYEDREEFVTMFEAPSITTLSRERTRVATPAGIASYRQFRWVVDVTSSGTQYVSAYMFEYCKPTGTSICQGIDDYPPVAEGEISPSTCPRGFSGYSYRQCSNGQLGEVQTDKCSYRKPANIRYSNQRFTLVLNTEIKIDAPWYRNIITKFYLEQNTFLPDGLVLDEKTGAITGKPTSESGLKTYTIYGENPSGADSTTINISVRKGECKAEGNFPKTSVGEIAEYNCAVAGSYVGTQKRACILGAKDGEWQKIQGTCMPISMIVIIVIIVIIVVAVGVLFLVRATKKTKAVGGVKGKKSTKSTKKAAPSKKTSTKAVKV